MPSVKRSLKDTINDPKIPKPARVKKTPAANKIAAKIVLALVLGFAGGFGAARFIRF